MEYKEALRKLLIKSKIYEYYIDHIGSVFRKHPNYNRFDAHINEMSPKGYCRVNVNNKKIHIHRLVALAFIPNPENKPFVNHIDSDKTNNHYTNLEWCTNSENMLHFRRNVIQDIGKQKEQGHKYGGKQNPKFVRQIHPNGMECIYPSVKSIYKTVGIQAKGVLSGRYKTAGGYKWEYV